MVERCLQEKEHICAKNFIVRLKPNTHRRRRRDSTVELSRVGGVY